MSAHLREAWHRLAAETVTLYHGTNQAALDAIRRDGEFRVMNPEVVNHEIENRYGLPYDSVWRHKFNTFSHGRVTDPSIWFHSDNSIAREYAEIGSEVISDALLSALHLLMWDELVDETGDYRPGAVAKKDAWIAGETRKHYKPVVLTVELPWDRSSDPSGSVSLPAPIPASVIRSTGRKLAYRATMPPEPGQSPLPSGTYRMFHATAEWNLESVQRNGLTISTARGHTYGEPDLIWFSNRDEYWGNGKSGKILVEVAIPRNEVDTSRLDVMGGPNGNLAVPFDVPVSWIIAIHEPWHVSYRFLSDPKSRERVAEGFYDYVSGASDPGDYRAIQEIKREEGAL